MATIVDNQDATLTVTLTPGEADTVSGLPDGQLASYITQWLDDHAGSVLKARFEKLDDTEKESVRTTLKQTNRKEK